jgi:hypothetical protein
VEKKVAVPSSINAVLAEAHIIKAIGKAVPSCK